LSPSLRCRLQHPFRRVIDYDFSGSFGRFGLSLISFKRFHRNVAAKSIRRA